MAMSQEQIKLQRKILKHRNRAVAYHFQLPAYMQMIHNLNTAPFLNSNMVTLLEALMDLLGRVLEFDGFQPPESDEYDFRRMGVGFSFGCNYCHSRCMNARQVLDHVMIDDHSQLNRHLGKKFQRFKRQAGESYKMFLFKKHETMVKNRLPLKLFDKMIDFSLITKNFLKMTTRYLASLTMLERDPSTTIGLGVIDLLGMIDSLVSRAKCIETVQDFNSVMNQLLVGDMKFECRGRVFDNVQMALEYAAAVCKLKQQNVAPKEGNVFSLPQVINQPSQLQSSPFTVPPPLICNVPRPNIPPFTTGPAIRMGPPPPQPVVPIVQPPMMNASMVRVGLDMQVINIGAQHQQQQQQQQQQLIQMQQHLLFNPSMMNMVQNLPSPQQLAQYQQQQMAFQQLPSQPQPPPVSPGGQANRTNDLHLPPLNQSSVALSADLLHFLRRPNVDGLIENGNVLVDFAKSSIVPSEIACALKAISPNVRVECYGAKVCGVGYEEDNVNLFIDDGNHPKTAESVKLLFEALKNFFINNSDEWVIQDIHEAEVRTHLTVKNGCENVCCRIIFASEIYCYNSKLIRYYVETFPMCQKLCYFVQEFIKLTDLDINRYILIVLVLFYLQKRDYLPTVAQLQSQVPEEKLSGPWLINFVPRKADDLQTLKLKPCGEDLRQSAADFFLFYGKQFSFQESVVCPQIGLALSRADFLAEKMWRMPLKRYRVYFEECQQANGDATSAGGSNNFARFELTSMCVQDPLELTTNIAAQVSSEATGKFVQMCKMAYEFYSNNQ